MTNKLSQSQYDLDYKQKPFNIYFDFEHTQFD